MRFLTSRSGLIPDTAGACPVHEFESDLIRMRTREGMKGAKAKGLYDMKRGSCGRDTMLSLT